VKSRESLAGERCGSAAARRAFSAAEQAHAPFAPKHKRYMPALFMVRERRRSVIVEALLLFYLPFPPAYKGACHAANRKIIRGGARYVARRTAIERRRCCVIPCPTPFMKPRRLFCHTNRNKTVLGI